MKEGRTQLSNDQATPGSQTGPELGQGGLEMGQGQGRKEGVHEQERKEKMKNKKIIIW